MKSGWEITQKSHKKKEWEDLSWSAVSTSYLKVWTLHRHINSDSSRVKNLLWMEIPQLRLHYVRLTAITYKGIQNNNLFIKCLSPVLSPLHSVDAIFTTEAVFTVVISPVLQAWKSPWLRNNYLPPGWDRQWVHSNRKSRLIMQVAEVRNTTSQGNWGHVRCFVYRQVWVADGKWKWKEARTVVCPSAYLMVQR